MSNYNPMSLADESAALQAYADREPTFASEADAQSWAMAESLRQSHEAIGRQCAEKRRQEQYATPTGALYDAYGRLQTKMDDDTIIDVAGMSMRLGDAKTAGFIDGDGLYSEDGLEREDAEEERAEAGVLSSQLQLAETLVGPDGLAACLDGDNASLAALSAKAGCSMQDTTDMLDAVIDKGIADLEQRLSFHLPGYDVDQVLEVAISSPKGVAEIRRAAVGLTRGSAVEFNTLLHRYSKEYGFKVR